MTEDREKLIRRYTDEVWNKGNVDLCDDIFETHASIHDPSFPVNGVKGIKDQVRQLRVAQPDFRLDVHDVLVAGDMTATRYTLSGTSKKEFRGVPPTGKSYAMSGMTIDKWQNDRIIEEWTVYDLLGCLQQLGIIPEMAQMSTNA
ncbi:MAG TPA: ester cyclase [Dermatophilaceae bacterium]|nr:ester cyclase [Dermatophilaceae bacterium]